MDNKLRALIRKEIQNIISEETDKGKSEDESTNRVDALNKINAAYTRTLRNNLQDITADELADAFMDIMSSLGYERGMKIGVLRNIKNKLQL